MQGKDFWQVHGQLLCTFQFHSDARERLAEKEVKHILGSFNSILMQGKALVMSVAVALSFSFNSILMQGKEMTKQKVLALHLFQFHSDARESELAFNRLGGNIVSIPF